MEQVRFRFMDTDWIKMKLAAATVGIAGAGGLGSTVATALARAGVGRLIIADFDKVEQSNLNRQHYFRDQVGVAKVEALAENLRRIDEAVKVETHNVRVTAENVEQLFGQADIVAECLDAAEQKQMLVETVLTALDKPVVSASGMAGFGGSNRIRTRRVSPNFIVAGDEISGIETQPYLTAARVWIVACHQANAILELLLTGDVNPQGAADSDIYKGKLL